MDNKEELKAIFVTGAVPTEADFHNLIDVAGEKGDTGAKGDKGEPGAAGAKGATGSAGADGKDGFGTKEQYDAIIARLDALDSPAE